MSTHARTKRLAFVLAATVTAALAGALAHPAAAHAANESVNIWLTTTNDSGGRNVTRGLQQQAPVSFGSSSPGADQTIRLDENAQYFVKYVQAYQANGVPVDYVSAQNEPTCCGSDDTNYGSMNWNGSGLDYFSVNDLLPAFHAAGLSTKLLVLDSATFRSVVAQSLGTTPDFDQIIRDRIGAAPSTA